MNRYIKAMEIGLANEENGITYSDLVEQMEKELETKFNANSEYTFLNWFLENFDFRGSKDQINGTERMKLMEGFINVVLFTRYEIDFPNTDFKLIDNVPEIYKADFYLKGQAAKQYLDYIELTDARKNAKQTSGFSIFSIFVAVVAIFIGVFQNIGTPKPPFDVNVIQDKTRTKDLEKENEELKEKLYEAETLIGIYKSEKPSE